MASQERTLAGYRREILKTNRRLRRITSKKGSLWERLSSEKTSLLEAMWVRCDHPEVAIGPVAMSGATPNARIRQDIAVCRDCGFDATAGSREYRRVFRRSRKTRLSEGRFLIELGKIIRRTGINL